MAVHRIEETIPFAPIHIAAMVVPEARNLSGDPLAQRKIMPHLEEHNQGAKA